MGLSCGPEPPPNAVVVTGPVRLLDVLDRAQVLARDRGRAQVESSTVWVEDVDEQALLTIAPCQVVFPVKLEHAVVLETAIALDATAWQTPGDGVTFYVAVRAGDRFEYLYSDSSRPHYIESDRRWKPVEIDLMPYQGKTIELILGADSGGYGDTTGDLGVWKDPLLWNPIRDQRPSRPLPQPLEVRVGARLLDWLPQARILVNDPSRPREFVSEITMQVHGVSAAALYEHPISKVVFSLTLTEPLVLETALGLKPEVWDKSDGVVFSVIVSDGEQVRSLARELIDPRRQPKHRAWVPLRIDLREYRGKTIKLMFATEPGPNGETSYDWAAWKDPRFVQP